MIIIPATLESIKTRSDGTISLQFGTQELGNENAGQLFGLVRKYGYLAIKQDDFGAGEIEKIEALEADVYADPRKSASGRLRAVLFVNFQNDSEGHADFNTYYLSKMEKFIVHCKSKLPK